MRCPTGRGEKEWGPEDAFAGRVERDEVPARQEDVRQRADLTPQECVRAETLAAAPANVRRAAAMAGYLRRLEEFRFGAEWVRRFLDSTLVTPRLPDAAERTADLGIPVPLVHGRQDMTFPAGLVEPTLRLIPRARAVVLEEAGHMLHVDDPDGWLCAVREHLEQGWARSRPRLVGLRTAAQAEPPSSAGFS